MVSHKLKAWLEILGSLLVIGGFYLPLLQFDPAGYAPGDLLTSGVTAAEYATSVNPVVYGVLGTGGGLLLIGLLSLTPTVSGHVLRAMRLGLHAVNGTAIVEATIFHFSAVTSPYFAVLTGGRTTAGLLSALTAHSHPGVGLWVIVLGLALAGVSPWLPTKSARARSLPTRTNDQPQDPTARPQSKGSAS